MEVVPGSTDVTTYFVLRTAADGTETTGATITDIDLQYVRTGAAPSAKVDATALAATDSAHADNKAIEIDGTDQKGLYRVDWPDAAFAAGVRQVILSVTLASSFVEHKEVDLKALPLTAAEVNTQADTALSDYDPPTKAELDSGLAGLNDLDAAAVNAEVDTALGDYDAPTKAEMDTGFAALNDVSTADVNAQCDAAIETYGLDHLLAAAVAGGDITDDSIIAFLVSKEATADWDDFDNTTDSLQAIHDAQGAGDATEAKQDEILVDIVDIKGTGFAKDTHSLVNLVPGSAVNLVISGQEVTIE